MPASTVKPVRNRSLKGIAGYRPPLRQDGFPIRFHGKDHSKRPAGSTKRLGRKRGPGGGGVQGAMRRLAAQVKSQGGWS